MRGRASPPRRRPANPHANPNPNPDSNPNPKPSPNPNPNQARLRGLQLTSIELVHAWLDA